MVKAFTLESIGLCSISLLNDTKRPFKMIFTAFLIAVQNERENVEKNLANLLVVCLSKTLYEIPPSFCARQLVGPNCLPIALTLSDLGDASRA